MAGWHRKGSAPKREEGREQREARTEGRGKREESRDKREDIMNRVGDSTHGIEASQDHDDKEKREERRKKREETPKEAAKGLQMRPPEGGQPFSWPCRPPVGPLAASRAEGREQRKERREKRENGRQLDSLHFYGVPWPPQRSYENQKEPPKMPQARFTAFLRCPVTTSMRTPKTPTSVRGSLSQKC